MVLYKRKPVQYLPQPIKLPDSAEIFVMRGTREIFTEYDKYIQRYDFLAQKKFVDAVNGKSGLSFFAALESETKSSTAIENIFPEPLRDPILRLVQFSTTARMDDLVKEVYDELKHDFFPGEEVTCLFEDTEPMSGIIREKAKFPMIRGPSGEVQREAFSRYFVQLIHPRKDPLSTRPDNEGLVENKNIRRDRKVFTKLNLRAFLKHSLQREAWNGAPWLVKEPLAIQYRLPMEIPAHLLQEAKVLATKQQMLQNHQIPRRRPKNMTPDEFRRIKQEENARVQQMQQQQPGSAQQRQAAAAPKAPPVPAIKYPIEDLDLEPKRNGVKRPKLKSFRSDEAFSSVSDESVGMLLEVWNTLNVQCEVYCLDSFTFDDFVDAMAFRSSDITCELLEEMHCAVLKLLVDDQAKVTLTKGALPERPTEAAEEAEELHDESRPSTPLPDAPARSTRSRFSNISAVSNGVVDKVHRVQELLGDRSWITRLGARDFEDGGWQVILAGLLSHLSLLPHFKARCDDVLAHLAPETEEPTRETARLQYAKMDINLRISALQMVTILSIATPKIREFLETCSDDMTDVRKRKIEYQKEKKAAMEALQNKDRERKLAEPPNTVSESPKQESNEPSALADDEATESSIDASGAISSDPEDEAPSNGRGLRRGIDRKRKRDEEAARAAEERARKAEAAKKENKQSREFKKLLADIEDLKSKILDAENKIAECDSDLREANVQRTKVLGKDRFCNRYYWYERNGQPFGGLPRSSTASHGYANGRIWVQGPDAMELEGMVGSNREQQAEYQRRHGLTVLERRQLEEGETSLRDAHAWGFYDDPTVLDNLIHWLDERGDRERALRKELVAWRDTVVEYMDVRKQFRNELAAKRVEADEEAHSRIATRRHEREEVAAARSNCLRWTNSMAVDEHGHLHSQPPGKPKTRNKTAAIAAAQPRQTRGVAIPVNRQGKPLSRQGLK